jgi:zinc transporter, ZIP family
MGAALGWGALGASALLIGAFIAYQFTPSRKVIAVVMALGTGLRRVMLMWSAVVVVSALSAAAGYLLLDPASRSTAALVQAFAAGALLAMLADTLLPQAYAVEGVLTGPLVVTGFAVSLALSAI